MKRILFLTNYPSPYRVEFFDTLGKQAELTVLFSDRKEKKQHRSRDWFISGSGNFKSVQLSRRLASVRGKDLCTDVISWLKKPWDHIILCGYGTPTAILAMFYLKMRKIPFWMEVDGGLIREDSRPKYFLKKKLVTCASSWLSSGSYTTDFLAHYGADRSRIFEYPFSSLYEADILRELPTRKEKLALRKELSMEEEYVVLAIGQFIKRKGFDVLLKAAAKLPPNVGIYIVGGLPTEEYTAMRSQMELHHVHFAGFHKKEELKKYYMASDLFVLPTREDIWGLVVGEAMAYGLPVITTDRCVAGLTLVKDGVSGYVVPTEDEKKLAEKIETAIHGDLTAMGQAALEAVKPYTIENMAKVHMEILEGRG